MITVEESVSGMAGVWEVLVNPLIARSLNLRTQADAQAVRWSPDRVRLMYVADMLPELLVQNPKFTSQKGKTLYCLDLALPQGTP